MKALLCSVVLLSLFSAMAFGLGGKLVSPSLAYRSDIDAGRKEEIGKVLKFMREDLTFIDGSFINEFSNQRFGGTSAKVARLIELLSGPGLWEVHVQFRDFGEQTSAFTLDQESSKNYLRLIINSGRKDFLLNDFANHLPPPKLPQSEPAKGNQVSQSPVR